MDVDFGFGLMRLEIVTKIDSWVIMVYNSIKVEYIDISFQYQYLK